MKKLLLMVFLSLAITVVGCSKTEQDPYQDFRGETSNALFTKASTALAKGNYDTSVKYFEALDALYPFGPYAERGQMDIIYAYFMDGDDASSITAADRYVRLYPRGKNVDYAYYMRGVVGFNLGLSWLQKKVGINPGLRDVSTLQTSFASFSIVADEYPHSIYAEDSLVRMAYIRNLLANREIAVAKFYMEREAYVAAANRASYVVSHFQGSDQVSQALAIMIKAYRKLGLAKMAQSSYDLLKTNFPDSRDYHRLRHT